MQAEHQAPPCNAHQFISGLVLYLHHLNAICLQINEETNKLESSCLFDQSLRCSLSRSWSNSWVIPTNNALFGCNRLTAAKLCKNINQTLLHISQLGSAVSMVKLCSTITWLQPLSFHMLLKQLKIIQIRKNKYKLISTSGKQKCVLCFPTWKHYKA